MSLNLEREPLSAAEFLLGGVALMTVALIAFGCMPFTRLRNTSLAPKHYASVSIEPSEALARLSLEQPNELADVPAATHDEQSPDTRSDPARSPIEANGAEPPPDPPREDSWAALNADWPFQLRLQQYGIEVDSRGVFTGVIWGPPLSSTPRDPPPDDHRRRVPDVPGVGADASFIGGWTDNIGRCRTRRKVPLVISFRAAKTANGECDFGSVARETANRWRVTAMCAAQGKFWRANIALKLTEPKLTWSSERGTETYVRCNS